MTSIMRRNSKSPRGQRAKVIIKCQEGFTFLELLIVLLIVSACAAITLPRLSGAYSMMRIDRQKNAIEELVRHATRCSQLTGHPYSLSWDESKRTFELKREAHETSRGHRGLTSDVNARYFTEFVLNITDTSPYAGRVSGSGATPQTMSSVLTIDYRDNNDLTARLPLAGTVDISVLNFPVRFTSSGLTSVGSILISSGGRSMEEFVIHRVGSGSAWVSL